MIDEGIHFVSFNQASQFLYCRVYQFEFMENLIQLIIYFHGLHILYFVYENLCGFEYMHV